MELIILLATTPSYDGIGLARNHFTIDLLEDRDVNKLFDNNRGVAQTISLYDRQVLTEIEEWLFRKKLNYHSLSNNYKLASNEVSQQRDTALTQVVLLKLYPGIRISGIQCFMNVIFTSYGSDMFK